MNLIFADCFSGISGDMLLSALLDLGIDKDWLQSELSSLKIPPFTLQTNRVKKGSIHCIQCKVISNELQKVKRGLREISEIIEKSAINKNIKNQAISLFQLLANIEAKIHGIPVSDIHFHEIGAIDSLVEIIGVLIGVY